MPFTAPDGKQFEKREDWRDYMMSTFYSFKNKVNEPQPLVKNPGEIDGQMFDISDCSNSTLVVMDLCEQVQIDELKDCRVFVGACASSIFIRNCSNCTFYTCCRQLRLRDVNNSTFYIYSMAEVHIEDTSGVKFAPFNAAYPDHASHLRDAKLDISRNLWYDIFDHNDPAKSHKNWALLPECDYEPFWFPSGIQCSPAIPRTRPGSVKFESPQAENMQSFSFDQLVKDAASISGTSSPKPPAPPAAVGVAASSSPSKASTPAPPAPAAPPSAATASAGAGDITGFITSFFANSSGVAAGEAANEEGTLTQADGEMIELSSAPLGYTVPLVDNIGVSRDGSMAWVSLILSKPGTARGSLATCILNKTGTGGWCVVHVQMSAAFALDA